MLENVFIEYDKEHQGNQVDEDDIDAIVCVFVILQSNRLIGAQEDDNGTTTVYHVSLSRRA